MNDGVNSGALLSPGSMFAGLMIEREIGRGGAGVVYLARDRSLDRAVALKILNRIAISEDPAAAERFRTEAQLAARLEHPAIIPVYATGIEHGMAYISMRFVPGRSLADLISQDGPLSPTEAIELLQPIAAALDYAAQQRIVHRDVKPGNILIDESSSPRRALLGDFGIARAYEATHHTATGAWVGTPDYIAPEILKDKPATASADQYSLACVMVEAVSGISPFKRSTTAATITAQVAEQPDLATISQIEPRTRVAIEKALTKTPADRFTSCLEFLGAAQAGIRSGAVASPNTVVRGTKSIQPPRRTKRIAIIAAGAAVVIVVAAAVGFRALSSGSKADSAAKTAKPTENQAVPLSPTTDVLIVGTRLRTWSKNWIYQPGQNAATALKTALATNSSTQSLRVKIVEATTIASCTSDVRDALATRPSTAIVVFGTACQTTVVKRIRSISSSLPPVFYESGFPEGEIDFMAMAPPNLFHRSPNIEKLLSDRYGGSTAGKVALLDPTVSYAGMFEAGVFSRHLPAKHCATFIEAGAETNIATTQPMGAAILQAGRGSADTVALIPIALTLPINGQLEGIDSKIRDLGVDCLVAPPTSGIDTWLKKGLVHALESNHELRTIMPGYLESSLPTMPKNLRARIYTIDVSTYFPTSLITTFRDAINPVFGTRATEVSTTASQIYLTSMLIGQIKTDGERGAMPTLAKGVWAMAESGAISGGGTYSIQDQEVVFNPNTAIYSWYPVTVTQLSTSSGKPKTWIYFGGRDTPLDLPSSISW